MAKHVCKHKPLTSSMFRHRQGYMCNRIIITAGQKAMYCRLKDGLLACNTWLFKVQNTAIYIALKAVLELIIISNDA